MQRHRRLDQVSGAVELVSPRQLDEPLPGESHLEVRVEVSIGLLGVAEQPLGRDQLLTQPIGRRRIKHRIGERPGNRLQPLIHVAVQKRQVVDIAASGAARSQLQVVEVADLVQSVPATGDAHLSVEPPSIRPQSSGNLRCGGRPESCGAACC
jgi:hypothetical protein